MKQKPDFIHRPMSGRQHAMLQALYDAGLSGHMSIEEAQALNQATFRSMLIRGYCSYRSNGARGFHLTTEGREAMENFHTANIARKNPNAPITSYFDMSQYGLAPRKPQRLHVMAKRGAA